MKKKLTKNKSLLVVLLCYILAIASSIIFIYYYKGDNLIFTLLYADIIATIIIYLASYIFKNSSIYDPYWSVIPPLLLLFWIFKIDNLNMINAYLLTFSVLFWATRLTYNWIRSWQGLSHEDWRYIDLKHKT